MNENLLTKCNIGDKVWIMHLNRPLQCTITGIQITFSKGSFNYGFQFYKKEVLLKMICCGMEFRYNEDLYGISFFSTKEELIKSL